MNRRQKFFLAISSGILLWLAWPPLPFFPLLFMGFIPILWLEEICNESKKSARSFFGYSYLALLVWNLGTTWWVGATYFGTHDISTAIAGLIANTANPLLMCIPLIGFHHTRKKFGDTIGYISLPAYWITFEFIHLRWDLTWPWLTLGNGFAQFPAFVQWYDVTGALGGTLWIWVVNILLFRLLYIFLSGKIYLPYRKLIIAAGVTLFMPITISLLQYFTYKEKGTPQEVVLVQPNIDPYNAKFDPSTLDEQMQTLMRLSKEKVDSNTDYLIFPETALPDGIMVDELHTNHYIRELQKFRSSFPKLKIITGISAYAVYSTQETPTAHRDENGTYYDAFNSAIQLDSSQRVPIYHKSKLVPGVERMPYPELFKFLEPLALNMGGISGSLGSQKHRSVFFSADSIGAAPLICYESIYGEYTNEYVQRGANILFIITNDGWWGNTAGYKQHVQYGRLRAIETRRDVAQSANTGTSAFINQRGDLYDATPWWQPEVIKTLLMANRSETIYVKYGDVIGRISVMTTIVLLVISVFLWFKKKISPGKNHCMNLEKICKDAIEVAKAAGRFIASERKKFESSEIIHKGQRDLVSYVDVNAEKIIVEGLKKILPESSFLTEENTVESNGDSSLRWIIDPLDGTTNFIHGVPVYSVSIALEHNGDLVVGIVYEINLDECFYAWKGGGAFCNDKKISVTKIESLRDTLTATGFPYKEFPLMDRFFATLRYLFNNSHGVRRLGSAAVDLVYVACGRFDGFYEYSLNPWDVAGGALIVKEAGGTVTDFAGGNNFLFGKEIIASNTLIHREYLNVVLNPPMK